MGDINNMRNVANSSRNMKSYIKKGIKEKQNKSYLDDSTIKGTLSLLAPGASKKYKLSTKQRSKQLVGRFGLGIAGVAATFSIANAAVNSNANSINTNNTQYSSETQTLDKEDILNYAEEQLKAIVYKDRLNLIDRADVEISHNDRLDTDTITVSEDIKSINGPSEKYSYTRYNNPEHKDLNRNNNTSPEIKELLNLMIDVYNNPNPSQEDLEELEKMASNLKLNDFVLDGKNIVTEAERNSGFEIGD